MKKRKLTAWICKRYTVLGFLKVLKENYMFGGTHRNAVEYCGKDGIRKIRITIEELNPRSNEGEK